MDGEVVVRAFDVGDLVITTRHIYAFEGFIPKDEIVVILDVRFNGESPFLAVSLLTSNGKMQFRTTNMLYFWFSHCDDLDSGECSQ